MPTIDDIRWFKQQFGVQIKAALTGVPLDLDMIVAIACQATGYICRFFIKSSCRLTGSQRSALATR